MDKYIICMDASGDIDPKFAKDNNILFLPMNYTLSNEFRTCAEMESEEILHKFYDGQRSGDLTKTTQITPFQYSEYFEKYLKQGISIIYLSLSSGLSNTFQSAQLASQDLEEKYKNVKVIPIDSLSATGGIGVLVQLAVKNLNSGMTIDENAVNIKKMTHYIHHFFMVEDLMYLKRGGRISGATAIVGSLLNFKPILEIDPIGKLVTIDKKRGKKQGLLSLLSYFEGDFDSSITKDVYICHADCISSADFIKEEILQKHPGLNITVTMLSPVIGAHTGPDMVSILYLGKKS